MSTPVEVYTRPRCLFCHQVLELLHRARIPFRQIDVAERAEQDKLVARYQASSFPLVIVDGAYVGGYAHILHLHAQGRLVKLATVADLPAGAAPETVPATSLPAAIPTPLPARSHMGNMSRLSQLLKEDSTKKR